MKRSKRLFSVQAWLAVFLLFLVATLASRVVEKRSRTTPRLKPETVRFLSGLRGRLTFTYFGTGRDALPSAMKDVGDSVRLLLAALKDAAPDRIDCRVIDPDVDPQGRLYASRHAASPIRVRMVLRDESSEAPVWSSLAIAYERHPDGLIQGITPADIPRLEDLIVETLASADHAPRPTIAVAAPSRGYDQVRALCSSLIEGGASVVAADSDPDLRIPGEADLLLWIQPASPTGRDAAALERFLASGRSVILAGSTYAIEASLGKDGASHYRVVRAGTGWEDLLRSFGLTQEPLLLLDKTRAEITWRRDGGPVKVDAPFQFSVLPSCLNMGSLLGPNTGTLLVSAVSATHWDPARLAAAGRRAEVVATTSENARVMELPDEAFDDARLQGGKPVSKQPWVVLLKPQDSWRGHLLVAGSPTLFHDDAYAQGMNANENFLRTLLRTFASTQRLARIRVPRADPPRVAPLSLASRLSWRIVTVFLVPAALLVIALAGASTRPLGSGRSRWRLRAAGGIGAFVMVAALATLVGAVCPVRSDLTESAVNTPSLATVRRLDAIKAGLRVELLASEAFRMPPDLKRVEARVIGGLRALGIHPIIVRPEDLGEAERRKLQEDGAEPFDVPSVENDAATSTQVWSALRMSRSGRTEIIPRIDARSVEHLDFLIAAAAERLATGRTPVVGVLSDLPRLSPAEAHDYQTKGYTAPIGSDVYSDAKRLLQDYGYRVSYINPETQTFPDHMDLLVWLQPRYAQKSYRRFADFMAAGGRAIVAVQHYNVQQRQFRGKGFETVYWPQPQFHGFNDYLDLVGVRQIGEKRAGKDKELPGEVLFDRQHADLVLKTEVNRSAFRENDPQQVSRPFLIRAAGEGLSSASVITSKLGGLMFIWGSRFTLDRDRLARSGISSETLATTSPRVWTYAWSGGNIPESSFTEPADLLPGPQPLSILLEGRFPQVAFTKDEAGRDTMTLAGAESAPASAPDRPPIIPAPGKLLLVGCSEMFKNDYLQEHGYQHDQFLLNAAALLAYGPELAEVQARTYTPRVLAYQPENVVVEWRILTLALPPLAFIIYGILRGLLKRRPILKRAAS